MVTPGDPSTDVDLPGLSDGGGSLLPYPYFDDAERDRRWGLTRAAMAAAGIDCLVVPNNTGHSVHFQADARYLTHVGGGGDADVAAVFPLDGEPAAVVTNKERWESTQPWCKDLREARRSYGAGALSKLREVSLPNKRVGVVGLSDYVRAPEGTAMYGFMKVLTQGLPGVSWVNFSQEMEDIRIVKSDPEVAFLERSMAMVDAAYESAVAAAQPGVKDYAVWGAALATICQMGSEIPVHQHWIGARRPTKTLTRPTYGTVEAGWLFFSELEACYGGYHAQGAQPFSCGEPDPIFREMMAFAVDVWNQSFESLKPGNTVRQVAESVDAASKRLAPRTGLAAGATAQILMHGRGLGSDAPIVIRRARKQDAERPLAPGWCFVYKPTVYLDKYSLCWGDTVVITAAGARRLGRLPQEILVSEPARGTSR